MSAQAALQLRRVDAFAAARVQFEALPQLLRSEEALSMTHSDMERQLEQQGRELMRQLYQGWLDQQAPAAAAGRRRARPAGAGSRAEARRDAHRAGVDGVSCAGYLTRAR